MLLVSCGRSPVEVVREADLVGTWRVETIDEQPLPFLWPTPSEEDLYYVVGVTLWVRDDLYAMNLWAADRYVVTDGVEQFFTPAWGNDRGRIQIAKGRTVRFEHMSQFSSWSFREHKYRPDIEFRRGVLSLQIETEGVLRTLRYRKVSGGSPWD